VLFAGGRVVFSNKIRFPTTIHVHGLLYNKSSEGSPYNDGTPSAPATSDPENPFSAPPTPHLSALLGRCICRGPMRLSWFLKCAVLA